MSQVDFITLITNIGKTIIVIIYVVIDDNRSIVASISSDKRVLALTNKQGLQDTLNVLVDQLNRCQKALNEYLEVIHNINDIC